MLGGPGAPRYPIEERVQLIGRSEKAEISLLEPTVSRKHASIQVKGDKVELVDLGSKHGTFVNSKRISKARLRVGDIVVFGLSLVLRVEECPDPLPPVGPLRVPVRVPTLSEHEGDHCVTAVRDVKSVGIRPKSRTQPDLPILDDLDRLPRGITDSRQHSGTLALCTSLLTEADTRLAELRASLQEMIENGVELAEPYPILTSVESVQAVIARLRETVGDDESG
jgi:pSer/pThr/pTyr-binding forkhead associated (FHA) protein